MDTTNLRPLNVGIVCYPTHGGSGVVAVEIAHALARRGHQVHVVSYRKPARLDVLSPGIRFHPVDVPDYPLFEYPPYSLALAARLAEVICEFRLDVLHVHYAIPHAVSGYLARKLADREDDLPLITTLHGTDITIVGKNASYLPVTRFSLNSSDKVTVVSEWLRKQVPEKLGCGCTMEVIYNFVDTEVYRPREMCLLQERIAKKTPVLMHMSNFRPVKHVADVVDCYLKVRKKIECQLVMIGDGPDRGPAEARLRESPYRKDVHFLGVQDKAEELLPCGDLFLFPSNAESFGLAALEAMACGMPVIGANVGGLTEVVRHGVDGVLVDPGASDIMARACEILLTDTERCKKMSAAARQRAIDTFTLETAIDKYEDLYWRSISDLLNDGPNVDNGKTVEICD